MARCNATGWSVPTIRASCRCRHSSSTIHSRSASILELWSPSSSIKQAGPAIILSDGDAVFQPRKIERSGLWAAVDGNVLIYVHKEQMLDDVERRYPADRYVMVDDKLRILTAMKQVWGPRLTTVWVVQGHYATDPNVTKQYPPADIRIESIGDLGKTLAY